LEYFAVMFSATKPVIPGAAWFYLKEYLVFYVSAICLSVPILPWIEKKNPSGIYYFARNLVIAAVSFISVVYLIKGVYNPFIYFNF
ncbi:MAG: MBOAT family protein, partial [Bacillota bacterium]|nr:MBOAT family protein [Bacillota bacterium]